MSSREKNKTNGYEESKNGFLTSSLFNLKDEPKRVILTDCFKVIDLEYKIGLLEIERDRYKALYEMALEARKMSESILDSGVVKHSSGSFLNRLFPNIFKR